MSTKKSNKKGGSCKLSTLLPTPVKGKCDAKEYRYIQLRNGLKVLLVDRTNEHLEEHEEKDLLSSTLLVDVGSFSDPPEAQGLTYLLQHLIQVNDDDEFMEIISSTTHCEHTVYSIECVEEAFDYVLMRFASLFMHEEWTESIVAKQKQVVNAHLEPTTFYYRTPKHILMSLRNPKQPSSLLMPEHLQRIRNNFTVEELYDKLIEFRNQQYSAHRMYLCLMARRGLDVLQEYAELYFNGIPNNAKPSDDFSKLSAEKAFTPDLWNTVYLAEGVNKVILTWVMPSVFDKYKYKPDKYVAAIIGHEGPGSVISYLRRQFLAIDIDVGSSTTASEFNNSIYSFFSIAITLTAKGVAEIGTVLNAVFSYIKVLKREPVSEDYYKEVKQIAAIKFNRLVATHEDIQDEELAMNLKYYEPRDVLGGSILFYAFNQTQIQTLINNLNTRNFNVMIIASEPCTNPIFTRKQEWFGVNYKCVDFPETWTGLWNNPTLIDSFHLPRCSECIPTEFNTIPEVVSPEFKTIISSPEISLWYRADDKLEGPEVALDHYLRSDLPHSDVRYTAMLELLPSILYFYLDEILFAATQWGMAYQITAKSQGLLIEMSGFSHKIHLVLESVAKFLANFTVDDAVFRHMKSQLLRNYRSLYTNPKRFSKELLRTTLYEVYFSSYVKFHALENLTSGDLLLFTARYSKSLTLQAIVQGSIAEQRAINMTQKFVEILGCTAPTVRLDLGIKRLLYGQKFIRLHSFQPNDGTTTVIIHFQLLDADTLSAVSTELTIALMQSAVKEKLGHLKVSLKFEENFGYLGYTFTAHTRKIEHTVQVINLAIEKFRFHFISILAAMTEHEFEECKQTLIEKKSQPGFNKIFDRLVKYHASIHITDNIFYRELKELALLKTLKLPDIYKVYEVMIMEARKLSIQIIGTTEDKKEECTPTLIEGHECVTDIGFFRENMLMLPLHQVFT